METNYAIYNQKTKIYETIEEWDVCPPNVLANKIKKVDSYLMNLKNEIKFINNLYHEEFEKDEALYKNLLRFHFKNIEDEYIFNKKPKTWSVEKIRDDETKKLRYNVYINKNWFYDYPQWIENYLSQMKNRLEESKIKSNEYANEEILCECGGKYTRKNISRHNKSLKHQKYCGEIA